MVGPVADAVADIVVVGAGHNALICAAYLAEAGLEVLVVEANDRIGGNTITEQLSLPGFSHDSCSSAHVVLQSNPLIRDDELGLLSRYGLRYVHTDPAFIMPLPKNGPKNGPKYGTDDGTDDALVVRRDVDATADELARWSPADAAALRTMMARWQGGLAGAHARFSAGLPPADDAAGAEAAREYAALRGRSAWDVVHSTFSHPVTRTMMTWLAFATIQPPRRPGTGALPAAIASGRLRFGWSIPVGGSGALPASLAAHLADHGGTVLTSAPVRRILTDSGRATGVEIADGRRYHARSAVVSSAHLAQLPSMLDGSVPARLRRAADAWRPGLALFAVHAALRADPRYRTAAGPTTAVAGALGGPDGLLRQIRGGTEGRLEEEDPWLLVVSSTVVDPDRAPGGGGVLKLLTTAPSHLAGGRSWDDGTAGSYGRHLLALAGRRLDGLGPDDVLAVEVESPASLARRNRHNLAGSCHGGEFDLGAGGIVPGWPDHRCPLPGLYLTGATTHPGGSVSGRPGRNAARQVLADLHLDPAAVMPAP